MLTLDPHDIDTTAIPRDRVGLDDTALTELKSSIQTIGLRQPIEVWRKSDPGSGPRYGLISGLRRLTAHRQLGLTQIAAFLREPTDIADAMAHMAAENEIRAQITPWEKGHFITQTVAEGLFDTIDTAIPRLYPNLCHNRRARLRAVAEVVDYFGRSLTEPTTLSQRQLTRIATALRAGLGETMSVALSQSSDRSPAVQWSLLSAILDEHEHEVKHGRPRYRKNRPRHFVHTREAITIRREKSKDGWIMRFTGKGATGPLMEDIMDYVEDLVGKR